MNQGTKGQSWGQIELLRQSALGRGLERQTLEQIGERAQQRHYRTGEELTGSDTGTGLYLVVNGGVHRLVGVPGNVIVTLEYCRRAGDVFTVGGASGDEARGPCVQAIQHTEVLCWSWEQLRALDHNVERIAERVVQIWQRQEAMTVELIQELLCCDLVTRVAHAIARCEEDGYTTPTHREVAERVGARPENVTKALHRLKDEHLINFPPHRKRSLVVLERERLRQY